MSDSKVPASVESERAVLGCCLIDAKLSLSRCVEALAGPEFYDMRHQEIFGAMVSLFEDNVLVDPVTLVTRLRDRQTLEQVGGIDYVARLADDVTSVLNLEGYLEAVAQKHALREVLRACRETIDDVERNGTPAEQLIDAAERRVMAVRTGRNSELARDTREVVAGALARIEEAWSRQGGVTGLAYPWPDLNRMTGGMHPGQSLVVGGKTGHGKTALAMNIVEAVALDQGLPVAVFSLEMEAEELMARVICSRGRVNQRRLSEGFASEGDFSRMSDAAAKLARARIHIHDCSDMTGTQFRAKARRMVYEFGARIIVLDYMQLVHGEDEDSRQEEVAFVSSCAKRAARELKVPVLSMSQLNEKNDTRESRAIEHDADAVLILRRDEEDGDEGGEAEAYTLLVRKQRNGPRGPVKLTFLPAYTRFESAARVSDADVPPPRPSREFE